MGQLVLHRLDPLFQKGDPISPFVKSEGFNSRWWKPGEFMSPYARMKDDFSVLQDGVEVARVKIDARRSGPYEGYGVPDSPHPFVEVVFIEVLEGCRLKSLGTDIIGMLMAEYPGANLMAGSEADGFWEHLRWDRYISDRNPTLARKLFIHWA